MRLKDKTALIMGSTSGIGRAIAFKLAGYGVKIVVTGRDSNRGNYNFDTLHG